MDAIDPKLIKRLTTRERELFDLAGLGLGRNEMARRLFLSPGAVTNRIVVIARKLGHEGGSCPEWLAAQSARFNMLNKQSA